MAEQEIHLIEDRQEGDVNARFGHEWRLVTDEVMGGVSNGQLTTETIAQRPCLRMRGDVKLENNGGFIQVALSISAETRHVISTYTGIMLEVYGNNEQYNLHLRTEDVHLPWQSYRTSFLALTEWKTLYIPFTGFEPYRIDTALDISRLKRIGLVAIGRKFKADLCIGKIGLYRRLNSTL